MIESANQGAQGTEKAKGNFRKWAVTMIADEDDDRDAGAEAALPFLNAGILHQKAGRLDEAEAEYRRALVEDPELGDTLHLLGQIAFLKGNYDQAIELILKALEDLPEDVSEPHFNLANAYTAKKCFAEAEASYRQALALEPGLVLAETYLARTLNFQGRFEEALLSCFRVFSQREVSAELQLQAGIALRGLRLNSAAEEVLRLALSKQPTSRENLAQLSALLVDQKRYDEALEINLRAVELWPRDRDILVATGATYSFLKDSANARCYFRRTVEADPDFAGGWTQLGVSERNFGNFAAAEQCFRRALEIEPNMPEALWNLTFNGRQSADAEEVDRLRKILIRPDISDGDRITAGFALGKVLDDVEEFDAAFDAYADANALFLKSQVKEDERFNASHFERRIAETIEQSSPAFFERVRGWGNPSDLPVFVVGMPRSGTTLVEQICATHTQAFGAGELRDMGDLARKLIEQHAGKARVDDWDAAEVRRAADRHVARLKQLSDGAIRVVDKLPDNVMLLNFIRMLFPNARIVYARRDPRDCGLSNFFQFYTHGNSFAFDLHDCGVRARGTEVLGAHWAKALPGPFLELRYEDLVGDLEDQSRRLIEFLGLEWEPQCLKFHETKRAVATPSTWQVRQPIYSRSVGRWRHYERHLRPLLEGYEGRVRRERP